MPTASFPNLKVMAMRDSVADAIRAAILENRFHQGEGLSEVSLASQLAVSRGPVREALLILAQEGLVSHQQNRGFFVAEFAAEDQAKIEQIRFPLESMALELARPHMTPADLETLRALKEQLVLSFRESRISDLIPAELQFHSMIWEKSGNIWLVTVLKRILVPSFVFTTALRMTRSNLSWEHVDRQHSIFIDYLAGTSSLSAEDCVRFHLSSRTPLSPSESGLN